VERQQALLQLAKRAGDGKLLSQKEHESSSSSVDLKSLRSNASEQQLSLDKENLVWNGPMETLALAPLLLADLVYAPVTQRQKIPSATHIVVLAPRRKGEAQREVWLLCVVAKTAQLQGLLGQLARRGCLRWDLQDCFKISKACQGAGGQGAVFSGMNLFPMEPPRLLPESSDMISLSCTHDYTDIAAKVWNKDCEASIRNEVSFLQQSGGHPNISVLLGLFCAESPGGRLRWALIMELCRGGDVHQHAHGNGINPHNAIEVLFGVLSALIHLHTLRIVHRDVKSENVIINCDHAVLVDFGIAAFLDDPVAMKACVGSPGYAAPEVIEGRPYNEMVDIFSCGVLLYFMLYGKLPFEGANSKEVMHQTVHGAVEYPDREVPQQLMSLMGRMLAKKSRKRPSAWQCFMDLRGEATADSLDSAAFKISLAGLVELGHMEKPAEVSLDNIIGQQGQVKKSGKLRSSEGRPKKEQAPSLSQTQQVDLSSMPAMSFGKISTRISQCLIRSVRQVPQFIRNVSSHLSKTGQTTPASIGSVQSVLSVVQGKSTGKVEFSESDVEDEPVVPPRAKTTVPEAACKAPAMQPRARTSQGPSLRSPEGKSTGKVEFSESDVEDEPEMQPRARTSMEEASEAPSTQPRAQTSQAGYVQYESRVRASLKIPEAGRLPVVKVKTEPEAPVQRATSEAPVLQPQESEVKHRDVEPLLQPKAQTSVEAQRVEPKVSSRSQTSNSRPKQKAWEVLQDVDDLRSLMGEGMDSRFSEPPVSSFAKGMRNIPQFLLNRRTKEALAAKDVMEAERSSSSQPVQDFRADTSPAPVPPKQPKRLVPTWRRWHRN